MIGAIAYLFTGIGEGNHERDISNTKQEILLDSDGKQWQSLDANMEWRISLIKEISDERVKNAEKWSEHYQELWQNGK